MSAIATSTRATAAVPAQRARRRGTVPTPMPMPLPLGSLTQQPVQTQACCASCGGTQVTRLEMRLTDGTPVQFTSCHRCEARRWDHDGVELSVQTVLERTRKTA